MEKEIQYSAETSKSDEVIDDYKRVSSAFSDFPRFEDPNSESRLEAKRRFIDNIDYLPDYRYPKLETFRYEESVAEKKRNVYEAVMEIEVARKSAEIIGATSRAAELKLYREFHDLRLKKIMLVEASVGLKANTSSGSQENLRRSYMELNREVYGDMNREWFMSMLGEELGKVNSLTAQSSEALDIAESLSGFLGGIEVEASAEGELLSESEMAELQRVVLEKYGPVLAAVPDTGDDVYYDANESAQIINLSLEAGGLAEKGWMCTVDSSKSNPVTNGASKKIKLPASTRRNASELKRLILHEQEVHARRAQNGADTGSTLLAGGTAGYADVEEGLGVIMECAVDGSLSNPSFKRARERYIVAGLALGLDNGVPRDAREVYEIVWRMLAVDGSSDGAIEGDVVEAAKNRAYMHIENAYRGTRFSLKGVIYTKLKVYYEGLVGNAEYLKDNMHRLSDAIDDSMIGKLNHTDPEEVLLVNETLGR